MNSSRGSIRFDGWTLCTTSGELTRGERTVRLQDQPLQVLIALLEVPGEVVTRESLIARLWPTGVVDFENGLNTAVRKLRAALEDDPESPRYVETIPRRGYRFIGSLDTAASGDLVEPSPPIAILDGAMAPVSRNRRRGAAIVAGIAVIAAMAGWLWLDQSQRRETRALAAAVELPPRTVAVLPFENLNAHQSDDFLAFGIAETILHQLATLHQLTVIARTSSFAFRGERLEVPEIGRRLKARFVLEGSVQRDADQMRVTAQLIDAATGNHVWSVKFDRPTRDLFAVQDEIARKVASAMKLTLDASAEQRLSGHGTSNLDAYLEYLRGRELVATFRAGDIRAAIEHYEQAINFDPEFSAAYSAIASAKRRALDFHFSDTVDVQWQQTQHDVRPLLERALQLDAANADAYETLAAMEDDLERAEMYGRRAVELEPNSARAHFGLSRILDWKSNEGPQVTDERLEHLDRAIQLDPLEPLYLTEKVVALLYRRTDRVAEIEPLLLKALTLDPNYFPALTRLGELRFCCQGRMAEGIKLAEEALKLEPSSTWVRNFLIHMYLSVGDVEAAQNLATDDDSSISRNAIYTHRREWTQATKALYENRNRQAEPDGQAFAILMDALETRQYRRAIDYLERRRDLTWTDGRPAYAVPMGDDCSDLIALAQLYRRAGESTRAQQLLELALERMHTAAVTYRRGNLWFPVARTRVFALLGRKEEALRELATVPFSGMANHWHEFEVDPAFDSLRADPRFIQFMTLMSRRESEQRALLSTMISQGLVPDRAHSASHTPSSTLTSTTGK